MRITAVLLLAALAFPAAAQEYPKLKAGLWEMDRSGSGGPPQMNKMTMCLDESVQRDMFTMGTGAMQGMCTKHDFRMSGSTGTGDFICDFGGSRMHSKSTLTLTGNTAYRTEINTSYDPPFMGQTQTTTVLTARHIGACKPGQRPGDMVLPTGQVINVRDAMNGAKGAPPKARPPGAERPKLERQPG